MCSTCWEIGRIKAWSYCLPGFYISQSPNSFKVAGNWNKDQTLLMDFQDTYWQKNGVLRTHSLFLWSLGNEHLIAANAVFFIVTIPTDKHGGLVLMQPWAGILMHQWLKASPTPFPSESYSCFKGWKHGEKTVNLRTIRFSFPLKKNQ